MEYTKPNFSYPLSNKAGETIPHEVSLPLGVLSLGFTVGQIQPIGPLGGNVAFVTAEATEDCYISSNNSFTQGVINNNTVYIPKGVAIVFSLAAFSPLPVDWDSLYCIGGSADGVLHIQTMGAWGQIGEDTQRSTL